MSHNVALIRHTIKKYLFIYLFFKTKFNYIKHEKIID
jgi:hypothetical protein